jgi:hypothetical protein
MGGGSEVQLLSFRKKISEVPAAHTHTHTLSINHTPTHTTHTHALSLSLAGRPTADDIAAVVLGHNRVAAGREDEELRNGHFPPPYTHKHTEREKEKEREREGEREKERERRREREENAAGFLHTGCRPKSHPE